MKKEITSILGKQLFNDNQSSWIPGLTLKNSNGDVDTTSLGYDYAIRTTTWLRAKSVQQKFYEVAPADFMDVEVGTGAFMENITTNVEFSMAADFEAGITNVAGGQADMPEVEVGISPVTYPIATWNFGYRYSIPELQKALAANNWDVVKGKTDALKKRWDLGIQRVAFLGLKSGLTGFYGLLTLPNTPTDVNTSIKGNISAMATDDFAAFVENVLGTYYASTNNTVLPDTFLMPMSDFLGLSAPVSPQYPMVTKGDYLEMAFQKGTKNKNFKIEGIVYAEASLHPSSVNRYMLYRRDPEVVKMDIPVNFQLTSPNTADNYNWKGVGYGQFTGCQNFRPRETYYMDWA